MSVKCSPILITVMCSHAGGKVVDTTGQEGDSSSCSERYPSSSEEETRHLTADRRWRDKGGVHMDCCTAVIYYYSADYMEVRNPTHAV